jgi:bis(5'-adenosyl)-triphosphatase
MAETLVFGKFPLHPDQVFFTSESGLTLGIVNICPTISGHVLVIPRRVAPRLADLTLEEVSDLFLSVQRIGKVVESHNEGCTSLTVTLQDGPQAGQTVPHVHVHVLPRRVGDFRRNDEVYEALHDMDLEHQFHAHTYPTPPSIPGQRRTIEEMAEEAKALKAHTF